MNREIKFRIYDNIQKKIIYPSNVAIYNNINKFGWYCPINKFSGTQQNGNEGHILMQYTGLKDKNNKEIYEGDIVKTDSEHLTALLKSTRESDEYTKYDKGIVKWWNEGFAICQSHIGATRISEYAHCNCCPCGLEIIGNIHENPELL